MHSTHKDVRGFAREFKRELIRMKKRDKIDFTGFIFPEAVRFLGKEQFLEFEACKIEDPEARSPWIIDNLLWVTEVKLCADMRHLSISNLEKNCKLQLRFSEINPRIGKDQKSLGN